MRWKYDSFRTGSHLALASGLTVLTIAALAIIGWISGSRFLASMGEPSVPMAPNTALSFIILGLSLVLLSNFRQPPLRLIRFSVSLVASIVALKLIESVSGIDVSVDRWFFHFPPDRFSSAPTGYMAASTAFCALCACASILLATVSGRRSGAGDTAGMLAIVSSSISLGFILDYVLGAPMHFSRTTIPMALNTAIAFCVLGGGVLLVIALQDARKLDGSLAKKVVVPIDRQILGGFGLAFGIVLSVGTVAYSTILQFLESNTLVINSYEVLAQLETTISSMEDLETGERGFVITGDDAFLEPYHKAANRISTDVFHLKKLTNEILQPSVHINVLDSLIAEQLHLYDRIVNVRRVEGSREADALVATGLGRARMDEIRTVINSMENDQHVYLADRLDDRQRSVQSAIFAFSFLSVFIVASLMAIYVVVRRELLQRQRAEAEVRETRNLLDSIIENIPAMIFVKDAQDLHFVRFNKAGEELTGYSREELLGRTDFDFFPEDEARYFQAKDREVLNEKRLLDIPREELHSKNQGTRILHTRKIVLLDAGGQPEYLVGISEDITARTRAEHQIEALNADLAQRARALEEANKELESFSYSVSHDLRAPLRSVEGFSQMLVKEYGDKIDEQGKDYLRRIRAASQKMADLIDDLLMLSRLARSEMNWETVDLSALAQSVVAELNENERSRTVAAKISGGMKTYGDARLLRVVLENLLGNAWKFTRNKPAPEIEFGSISQDGQTVFFVRDNGAGFDMTYAGKLFGAFQRLHTTSEFEGTGIGLATVQRIIHRHLGRVWAEGTVNEGATIFFTL